MKTTVYAWGAEKNNVLHIYAGMTTQRDMTYRLYGVRDIGVGVNSSWFKDQEVSSTLGAHNLDLIYADSTQDYSRHKEQKAINAVWAIEQKYRNASLPVRALNSNRAVRLKNYMSLAKAPIGKPNRWTSVYGHVLSHINELEATANPEVFAAIESWIKEKVNSSSSIRRKFKKVIKAKSKKEAMIKNITKVLGLQPTSPRYRCDGALKQVV